MEPVGRPPLMGIATALLFAAGLFEIVYTFTGAYASRGIYYPAANTLTVILLFVALSLAWERERWGVYLFLLGVALKSALDLWTGAFGWWDWLLLIPCGYLLFFRSRFS